ncbi:MAG: FprA family A-type flavoprotein [Thermoproteota archaeon]
MSSVKVLEDVFWVGAVDWNIRHFHGFTYSTHQGTTYNSYLIRDEKTVLVDTVYDPFTEELVENIQEVVDPSSIDYVIANHVETDHSGAISEILKLASNAKVVGTERCKQGLQKHYFGDWDFQVVKTGDEISLGDRDLKFVEAPMLHWPDSMFTYIPQDNLLMPNDAFGQHWATSQRFDDQVNETMLMDKSAKYYANILWPFSRLVVRKIKEIMEWGLPIDMIAPSHGLIWRENPEKIVEAYLRWGKGEAKEKILVVYDTMWGSTEKMAKAMVQGIIDEGVEAELWRLPFSDTGDILKELLEAKGILIGSSTINNGILPEVAPFLTDLQGLRPRNKLGAAFGSYGWGGGAVKTIEGTMEKAGIEKTLSSLEIKWAPNTEELQRCLDFGSEFAKKVKKST